MEDKSSADQEGMSLMKKMLLLLALGALCVAGSAFAGLNPNVTCDLSWNALSLVTDTNPSAINSMYVRYTAPAGSELSFKGGEIDITWDPAGDGNGCFDRVGVTYKTSLGTTCTYLNRGVAVPVIVNDDPNHFHVAWANNSSLTTCTSGAGIQIQFETDTCADGTGCFSLNEAIILDAANGNDLCHIGNAIVTVGGGGSHNCAATAVQPSTWGAIKNIYNK